MAKINSSVLPVSGLRRDSNGNLTSDALSIIIDGLKSRSIDPTDPETKKKLLGDLVILLCSVNNQYQFLLKEIYSKVQANENISSELVDAAKDKNITMQDIINVSGHLKIVPAFDESSTFIEGWQNAGQDDGPSQDITHLQNDRDMLDSKSYLELRKRMVEVTGEKNKVASNYLGLYGFLNLVAIGLLIYVSAAPTR